MKRKIISVWEVNHYVGRLIEEDYMLSDLWIQGEVSNCKYHSSGHIYFTIKDDKASINAVMFARDASKLSFKLTEGTKIYARIRITIYEKTGAYQAYVYDIEKQGKGLLYDQFERLKNQLKIEGLFNEEHKKKLPIYAKNVGIVTSSTGAAIKDIIKVAKRRNQSINLIIYPSAVQGENAVKEIVSAIRVANTENKVDVLIVGRGGGSIEDLWAFNTEEVARAIFESKIPIVSAIGHEVDFTIADFVSDKRAATPSAAAELVVFSSQETIEKIIQSQYRISNHTKSLIQSLSQKLDYIISRPVYANKDIYYKQRMQEIVDLSDKLSIGYKNIIIDKERSYERLVYKLEQLSPLKTLNRGYSLVSKEGNLVSSIDDVDVEEILNITMQDGELVVKVCEKEKANAKKSRKKF